MSEQGRGVNETDSRFPRISECDHGVAICSRVLFFVCFYDFIEMIKMVDLRVGDYVLYSELFLHAKICFKKN